MYFHNQRVDDETIIKDVKVSTYIYIHVYITIY